MEFRTILCIPLLVLFSYQCTSNQNKVEAIVRIEGKIGNGSIENLSLLNHSGDTVNTLFVAPNTNFKQDLKNIEEGYFTLSYGKKQNHLYLYPGDSLHLNINEDELLISGKGSERNNYLKSKYSPEFNWYSNYYKTKQKGDMMVYFRDHYIKKLKQKLEGLSDESQFAQTELLELDYKFADQLLTNQISLESGLSLTDSIAIDLDWAKSVNIEDTDALQKSKTYISLVARILVSQERADESTLTSYYNRISHPNLKTYFLSSLISPLHKELQFGEDDFGKAETIESFINKKQPKDSIGYHTFKLYHKFQDAKGKLASFSYEDVKGERVSLEELRGKYVYIDFWATWCVNCIKEFPYLKKIEERFKDEKIEFIGISIDKEEVKERWKTMVEKKELNNIQLFSPYQGYPEKDNIKDPFLKLVYLNSYYLGIPHYTLLDPEGKVVDAFFYRPSNNKIEKYISDLLADNQK